MTGRDLIIYILQNNLEDVEMFEDGKFACCFMSEEEMAVERDVGIDTIRAAYAIGLLKGVKIGNKIYFLKGQKDQKRGQHEQ